MKSRLLLLMLLMLFNTSMVWSATYLPEQKPMSSVRLPSGYTLREELPSFIDLKRWIVFNESELTGIWLYDKTSKRVQGGITSLWALIFPGSFANSDYKYYCANIDETDVIQV